MTIQNAEQEGNGGGTIFSSMVNTIVFITFITVVILPFLRKLRERLNHKESSSGSSSVAPQLNLAASSPVQGFYNSQASNESVSQINSLSSATPTNSSVNGSAQQSIQRSQNIQQWNDRNERFKLILEQEENPITTIDEYNAQIKKYIGQKISFNVKLLFAELSKKDLVANCLTYDFLMQIILDSKHIESALDLFSIFQNSFSNLEVVSPNIISLFLRAIQYGLNNQISPDNGVLMVDQLNSIVASNGIKLNEGSVIAMIDISLRTNKLNQALKTLGELERDDSWKTKEDFQKKRCELYFQILKNLKGVQYTENDETLSTLRGMIEYLNEKKEEENIYPDESMVNSLIDLCFQCNQSKFALDVYGYFDKFNISPSGVTYCILIKGYGQLKQYHYAMTIYQQMKTNKISLNEVTLGCLIDTCVKCNQLQRAEEILQEEKEIKPNTIIYTTLLKGYTKQENMKKALEIFEIMKNDKDLEPNIVSYNSLMECAVQCKDKEQMKKIFNEIMLQKDESKKADLITFSTYIKGLFKQGDIEEALEIFEDLRKQEQYKLDEIFYNSILDGLFKARSYEKTQLLYQKMRQDNIKPSNVTYSILIKLNSAQEKIDEALRILQEMKTMNVKPGLIVYTCIIQACIKHKRIKELLPLYEDMKKNNVRGDAVFYNTLVSGLMFNNCINDALKMTIDTLERKIILNQEVYQNLLSKVVSKKKTIENINIDEIEEQDEVRSRTYSGSKRFTSNFNQNGNGVNADVDQLTFQEMEKCLQKILLLLKKHQVEIDMDLYKEVVNQIFVNNNDEKKECLSYLNQKGTNNMSRQNWGSRTLINGPNGSNNNYKGQGGYQNNSNTNYATLSNKFKSQSFQQRKRAGDSANQSSGNVGEQFSYNNNNNNSNGGYATTRNQSYRTNGGFSSFNNNNNYHGGQSHSQTTINISGTSNNYNNGFYNRSQANSFSSNKSNSSSNAQGKRFTNKPKVGGVSINDLKNQLEQNQDSFEETKKSERMQRNFKNQSSIISNDSESDEAQDQLLLEKNLNEFEKDSDNSFDSKGESSSKTYSKQTKKSHYSKSKTQSNTHNFS